MTKILAPDEKERREAERRRKISEALKGRKKPAGFGEQVSARLKGQKTGPVSEETRQRMREAHTGKTHSAATRLKISQNRTGILHTEETRQRMSASQAARDHSYLQRGGHPRAKRINQLTPDGELVKTWNCMHDITDDPRFGTILSIRQCCQGKRDLYKGYRWEYADD